METASSIINRDTSGPDCDYHARTSLMFAHHVLLVPRKRCTTIFRPHCVSCLRSDFLCGGSSRTTNDCFFLSNLQMMQMLFVRYTMEEISHHRATRIALVMAVPPLLSTMATGGWSLSLLLLIIIIIIWRAVPNYGSRSSSTVVTFKH